MCTLIKKIEDPNCEAKLIYSDPWYWIILPNDSDDKIKIQNNITDLAIAKAKNEVHVKIQSEMNKKMNNLEDEITRIYEELYKREYSDSNDNYNSVPKWNNDIYGTHSTLSISEFTPLLSRSPSSCPSSCPYPSPRSYAKIHPEQQNIYYYHDEEILNSEYDNSTQLPESKKNEFPEITFDDRLWVTTHLCDNL